MYIVIDAKSTVRVYTSETFEEVKVTPDDIVLFVEYDEEGEIAVSEVDAEGDMSLIDPE
ncbi:MAG: hypothetical protein IPM51_11655 [Sphingobacteriaceae bacterium]|nr:hypothetical protein [Sphingobacteriaceae bacterium]